MFATLPRISIPANGVSTTTSANPTRATQAAITSRLNTNTRAATPPVTTHAAAVVTERPCTRTGTNSTTNQVIPRGSRWMYPP